MKANDSLQAVMLLGLICFGICSSGCKSERQAASHRESLTRTSLNAGDYKASSVPASLTVVVPENVRKIFKLKCFVCHDGEKAKGDFNFKRMVYRPDEQSDWQPIDLNGATRIKLAVLPIDGKAPKMPKKSGSILNPLTQQEANSIAKWTDYPFQP